MAARGQAAMPAAVVVLAEVVSEGADSAAVAEAAVAQEGDFRQEER